MAKQNYPKRYYRLGEKASMFWDPSAKNQERDDKALKVTPRVASPYLGPISKRMELAIKNRHIEEIDEDKALKMGLATVKPSASVALKEAKEKASNDDGPDFESMKKDDLIKYYKDNYDDVSEDDIEEFASKKKAEMIEYLSEED